MPQTLSFPLLNLLSIILALFLLLPSSKCAGLFFSKIQTCITQQKNFCKEWNNTVALYYSEGIRNVMCFPSKTKIIEEQKGIIDIESLQIGDSILGFDGKNGENKYGKVLAWIHRDTLIESQFVVLDTLQGNKYLASNYHYIAYNHNGTIGFKYAQFMGEGDQLITIGGKQIVKSSEQRIYQKGLFSPMTEMSNFYILPYNNENDKNNSLILVHCLSDIENPLSNQNWIHWLITVSDYLGLNSHQNQEYQQYIHPVTHLFGLFGSPQNSVKHRLIISEQEFNSLNGDNNDEIKDKHSPVHRASSRSSQREARKRKIICFFNLLLMINSVIIN